MTPPTRPRALTVVVIALAVIVIAVAAGAVIVVINSNGSATTASAPQSTSGVATPGTTPTPTATPLPLTRFEPEASIADDFALFNRTAATTIAATPNPGGRDFITALSAAGFDTSQMQLTADRTSVGLVSPSILFSVKVRDSCFIGQFTPSTREYNNQTVDPISTGSCLIGGTVAVR